MPATNLTPPETETPEIRRTTLRLMLLAAIVAGWIAWLAWLTWQTANPPVVNRVQVLASDLVVVGQWEDRSAGRFVVSRELKRGELTGNITMENASQARGSAALDQEWVVPLRQTQDAFAITFGKFRNFPAENGTAVAPEVVIEPQIYPATADVLKQFDEILSLGE